MDKELNNEMNPSEEQGGSRGGEKNSLGKMQNRCSKCTEYGSSRAKCFKPSG